MKKIGFLLLAFWLSSALSPAYGQKVERLNFVGGPPAGVFGIFATGIGTYLSRTVPNLDVSITATGGSVENLRRVNSAEAEMGLSFASDIHEAFFGQEQFKGKPLNNIRAVGLVFFGVAHAITFADSASAPPTTWLASASPLARRVREPLPAPNEFFVPWASGTSSIAFLCSAPRPAKR